MTTANPHLRAIAIAGALAAVAVLLGGYTLSHRNAGTSSPPEPALTVSHHPPAHTTAAAAAAKAKAARAGKPTAPAKAKAGAAAAPAPAKTTTAQAATKAKAAPAPAKPAAPAPVVQAALAYGLPQSVAEQFASHSVVLVSLYAPDSNVDQLTEAEAQAGAALGGAGFVPVESTKEGATGALTKLLGVLDVPTLLVFQRPDAAAVQQFVAAKAAAPKPRYPAAATTVTPPEFKLYVTLPGFNDRETVAQAARNADPDPGLPARQTAWAVRANALCTSASKQLASVGPVKTTAQLKQATPVYRKVGGAYLAGLRKLKAPAGQEGAVARFVALQAQDVSLTEQLAAAAAQHDDTAVATLTVKEDAVARESTTLATQLGASACGQGL